MKITAEFNSNRELLDFINTFKTKSIIQEQGIKIEPNFKEDLEKKDEAPKTDIEEETTENTEEDKTKKKVAEGPEITKEVIRNICAKAMKAGKQLEVKNIVAKYGAGKLPDLKKEHYEAVYEKVRGLV